MGTRGKIRVIINQKQYVVYVEFDGNFSGLGMSICNYIHEQVRNSSIEEFIKYFKSLDVINLTQLSPNSHPNNNLNNSDNDSDITNSDSANDGDNDNTTNNGGNPLDVKLNNKQILDYIKYGKFDEGKDVIKLWQKGLLPHVTTTQEYLHEYVLQLDDNIEDVYFEHDCCNGGSTDIFNLDNVPHNNP